MNKQRTFTLLIVLFFFPLIFAKQEGKKISLSVPKLTEEEIDSNHIPHHMKCDACLAVAYQIQEAFIKEQSKKSTIKESDIIDILEHICNKGFDGYGVKQVENINRLSGPGLETEHVMGMTQMGGRWPHRFVGVDNLATYPEGWYVCDSTQVLKELKFFFVSRLQEMCQYYVGEAGELDIYNAFTEGKDELSQFLCHGKGIYSHCVHPKKSVKTEL